MTRDSISDSSNSRCSGDAASLGSPNAKPVARTSGITNMSEGDVLCDTTMASSAALMTNPLIEPVADENQKDTRTGVRSLSHFVSTLNISSREACMEGLFVLYHGREVYEACKATWPDFFLDQAPQVRS